MTSLQLELMTNGGSNCTGRRLAVPKFWHFVFKSKKRLLNQLSKVCQADCLIYPSSFVLTSRLPLIITACVHEATVRHAGFRITFASFLFWIDVWEICLHLTSLISFDSSANITFNSWITADDTVLGNLASVRLSQSKLLYPWHTGGCLIKSSGLRLKNLSIYFSQQHK